MACKRSGVRISVAPHEVPGQAPDLDSAAGLSRSPDRHLTVVVGTGSWHWTAWIGPGWQPRAVRVWCALNMPVIVMPWLALVSMAGVCRRCCLPVARAVCGRAVAGSPGLARWCTRGRGAHSGGAGRMSDWMTAGGEIMSVALAEHTGPWTADDVEALPDAGDHACFEVYEGGVLVVSPAPGVGHQRASCRLHRALAQAAITAGADAEVLEAVNVALLRLFPRLRCRSAGRSNRPCMRKRESPSAGGWSCMARRRSPLAR